MSSEIDQDALQKAVAEEIKRLTSTGALQTQPGNALPDREKAGSYEFNPSTKRIVDSTSRRHLWRRDAIRSCPCGEVQWAHVQCFRGDREITDATRPVVDLKSGQVVQMAFEHAYAEYDAMGEAVRSSILIPEEFQMTPEKVKHLKQCKGVVRKELEDAGTFEEFSETEALKVVRMAARGA